MNTLISVQDLRVSFRMSKTHTTEAVKGMSFDIPANSTVARVGESGSGKSVTDMSIVRLLPENALIDTRSKILYNGRDLLGETRHFWLANPAGDVTATLRLMEEFPHGRTVFRIGRVATTKTERGRGHCTRLMQAALAEIGDDSCVISAQSHLAAMYARHGFVLDGAEFAEDGIPHVPMRRAARR